MFAETAGDFEASVAYSVGDNGQLVRAPSSDECATNALIAAQCGLRPRLTAEYFWNHRPLAMEAVKTRGVCWIEAYCSQDNRPGLPPELEAHAEDAYRSLEAAERRLSFAVVKGGQD